MEKKIKIGITGHTGYIGSHLIEYLKLRSLEPVLIDGNLTDPLEVEKNFKKRKIEIIIHLAGAFNPPFVNLIDKNVITTFNILDIGVKYGLKKIVYISSAAIYGEPLMDESVESDVPHPNTEYGLSKLLAENTIKYFTTLKNLKYIILRFPGVYGKGGRGVIDCFIKDINERKLITVFGDGNQKRNFLYIDDACESIYKSIFFEESGVFNIASTKSITLHEIIDVFKERYSFEVINKDSNNGLRSISLNIMNAKNRLQFTPKYTKLIV